MGKKAKKNSNEPARKNFTFTKFLADPVVATALLVFAFVALMFALEQFTRARGAFGG